MEKKVLNKYETYLAGQSADRKFSDPRVQKAFDRLHKARSHETTALLAPLAGGGPGTNDTIARNYEAMSSEIRKNRGTSHSGKGLKLESPFSTKKTPMGNAASNDASSKKNWTGKMKSFQGIEDGTLPKDLNKFTIKARQLMRKHPTLGKVVDFINKKPVKYGLAGLAGGAALGVIGYGIKKDIDGE